jgi:hypothetical protein
VDEYYFLVFGTEVPDLAMFVPVLKLIGILLPAGDTLTYPDISW